MIKRKYSAIVFDLGQVLLPFSYQSFIDFLNQRKSGLGKSFIKLYQENYHIHRSFEKGELSEEEFINLMLSWAENQITSDEFCQHWSNIFSLNEDVISLLPVLKEKYKLYLLSNTNSIHKKFGYEHYEFLNHFDKLFLSHEVGLIKPELEIYKLVQNHAQLPPEELIFIDDILEYVETPKKLGWDGIQFTNYINLVEEFKSRNIIH